MAGGGLVIQQFFQVFTANGSWTAPGNLVPGSVQGYAQGESGTAGTSSHGVRSGPGSGAGAFAGEPNWAGIVPGTVVTVTVPQGSTGNPTTLTAAGATTISANAGLAPVTTTGGLGGTAGANTIAFAGGSGANAISGASVAGGGGGGSAGSTSAGGSTTTSSAGAAGTGAAGPPSLAGAPGQVGGAALAAGNNGVAPGGGASGGGSGGSINHAGGTGAPGQAVIIWSVYVLAPLPIPRRTLARAFVQFRPVRTVNGSPAAPVSGTVQPISARPAPRRVLARASVRFTPVTTVNALIGTRAVFQPRATVPIPRRPISRALVRFTPVTTVNATVTRTLLISLAARPGTDDYGNAYPQGILATSGVIEGPELVGSDAFYYTPAPGFGNLTQSITSQAGTDGFGNAYLEGTTTYLNAGSFWTAVSISGATVDWFKANGPGGPWTFEAEIAFNWNNLTGGGLVLNAPAGLSGTVGAAPMQWPVPTPSASAAAIIAALQNAGIFQ